MKKTLYIFSVSILDFAKILLKAILSICNPFFAQNAKRTNTRMNIESGDYDEDGNFICA